MDERKERAGIITWADTGETMVFEDANEYLEQLRDTVECMGIMGYVFTTLTKDPAVRKAADDIFFDAAGVDNPHGIEYYEGGDNE